MKTGGANILTNHKLPTYRKSGVGEFARKMAVPCRPSGGRLDLLRPTFVPGSRFKDLPQMPPPILRFHRLKLLIASWLFAVPAVAAPPTTQPVDGLRQNTPAV